MRRLVCGLAFALMVGGAVVSATAQECGCSAGGCAGGCGGGAGFSGGMIYDGSVGFGGSMGFGGQSQLYPYDQQDTWLHGQYQRVPSYAGYNSFRPYNYRHVAAQSQIAANWGGTGGMPYSQQFWNRYKANYLNGALYSQNDATETAVPTNPEQSRILPVSFGQIPRIPTAPGGQTAERLVPVTTQSRQPVQNRPLHIYPSGTVNR